VGILIKTMRGRGAVIENVLAERITLKNVRRDELMVSMRYSATKPEPESERTPAVRHVTFRDIRGSSVERAGRIVGLEERDVQDIHLEKIAIAAKEGFALAWADGVALNDVTVQIEKGPAVVCADSRTISIDGLKMRRPVSGSPVIR